MIEWWAGPTVVVHGNVYEPHTLPGFVAVDRERWIGLVTFSMGLPGCEIVSLQSMQQGIGVGTALIESVVREACHRACGRVWVITTNDNMHALRFYQKRGFRLAAVHPNAVDRARLIKPSIPLTGNDGIAIHDEIELELILDQNL